MASKEVWKLTRILFRYMSPINYIIIYDHTTKTIHRNSKKPLWFWSQFCFVLLSLGVSEYYIFIRGSEIFKRSESLQTIAFMGAILYAAIGGLFVVFTITVGFNGNTCFNCFNTLVKLQQTLQSKFKFHFFYEYHNPRFSVNT